VKKTPLYDEHIKLKARMAPFAGWSMPVYFSGIIDEYNSCRNSSALFDTCHMGEFIIEGDLSELNYLVTQSLLHIKNGSASYGFILNENGGIIDDLIVFKISPTKVMLVVNAGTVEKDFLYLKERLKTAEIKDISSETSKIDVQGPLSGKVINDILGIDPELSFFNFNYYNYNGSEIIISRTGYTGELGYEIYSDNPKITELWNKFLKDERVRPAGLGARDILRLEMGYSLYGNDIDEDVTPVEAGLEFFIDFDKEFEGKEALLKQKNEGAERKKTAFKVNSRRSPRPGYKILAKDEEIGFVTSGAFSPALSKGIGMGYVKEKYSESGNEIVINGGTLRLEALTVKLPFYKEGSLKD